MRILRELDLDGLELLPVLIHHEAYARLLARTPGASDDLGHLARRELHDRAHGQEAERRHEHSEHGAVLRILELVGERSDRVVGRRRQEPGLRRQEVVVASRDGDELRVQRRRARSPVHGTEPLLAAEPERFEREHGARDRRLVDATERGEHRGGAGSEAVLLILGERGRPGHARHRRARCLRERHRARSRDVVHHAGHRDLREDGAVLRDLARHRDGEDGGVHRATGLVEVRVADLGDAEERWRRAVGEIDEALRDALDAAREDVAARLQVLEEPPHDDDGRGVHADDALIGREVLELETAETRRIGDLPEANLRGRRAEGPGAGAIADRDLLGECEELLAREVALDGELRATEALEELTELGGGLVGSARALEELAGHEDRFVREHDVDVRAGAQAVVADDLVRLFELARERLVRQVVHLRELGQAIDRDDDASAELTGVLAPDALPRVVRHDVEPHRHAVAPPPGAAGDAARR